MATASPRSATVTKTSFAREFLGDHPKAGFRAVNEAWNEAGHEGSISETLVHRMRAKLGLTGNLRATRSSRASAASPRPEASTTSTPPKPKARRGRPRKIPAETPPTPTPAPSPAEARPVVAAPKALPAASLEAEFDRLLFQVIDRGMPEVEEAIRTARRLFVLHHGR
jgi:hypothetical protein